MGDVVNISDYQNRCENCVYHGDDICLKPGGWDWDSRYHRCKDFKRRKDGDGNGGQSYL